MTELERLELALRSIKVDDAWTPSQLLDAIIREVTYRNNDVVKGRTASAEAAELEIRQREAWEKSMINSIIRGGS